MKFKTKAIIHYTKHPKLKKRLLYLYHTINNMPNHNQINPHSLLTIVQLLTSTESIRIPHIYVSHNGNIIAYWTHNPHKRIYATFTHNQINSICLQQNLPHNFHIYNINSKPNNFIHTLKQIQFHHITKP